jgi:hypothetical protein
VCYIITLGTDKEIPNQIINYYMSQNIILEQTLMGSRIKFYGDKYKFFYTLTNGMCSCDFIKKTSTEKKLAQYVPKLKSLIKDLYEQDLQMSIHVHFYRGVYQEENLPSPIKVKIKLSDFMERISSLGEDMIYVINKYIG